LVTTNNLGKCESGNAVPYPGVPVVMCWIGLLVANSIILSLRHPSMDSYLMNVKYFLAMLKISPISLSKNLAVLEKAHWLEKIAFYNCRFATLLAITIIVAVTLWMNCLPVMVSDNAYNAVDSMCAYLFSYNPREYYEKNAELRQCIDQIAGGFFSPEDPNLFRDIIHSLLSQDRSVFLILWMLHKHKLFK
jgi:Carbohydrate phosphorylase